MTAVDYAVPRLQTEEGFRTLPYTDTTGHMTMGYGLNVSAGISQRAAAVLLQEQVAELDEQLTAFPWYAQLDPARQSVCLDIAYNTGLHGLLAFPAMIAALARKDWMSASIECHVVDPKLANRYAELASLLLNGVPA